MPRYAFPPIPIRLPLSDVAALAEALAFTEGLAAPGCIALPRLALHFRLSEPRGLWPLTPGTFRRRPPVDAG